MPLSIEFSHTTLASNTTETELLSRVLDFENAYLAKRPNFLFHALVTNGKSRYGHLVVVTEKEAFSQAMADAPNTPAMGALMASLDMKNIRMQTDRILDETFALPLYFSSFKQGLFRPKNDKTFDVELLLERAQAVRSEYLKGRHEFLAQTVADAENGYYSELVFGTSLAHAEKTCAGYLDSNVCKKMLELCDPETTDLTFWTPLLQ